MLFVRMLQRSFNHPKSFQLSCALRRATSQSRPSHVPVTSPTYKSPVKTTQTQSGKISSKQRFCLIVFVSVFIGFNRARTAEDEKVCPSLGWLVQGGWASHGQPYFRTTPRCIKTNENGHKTQSGKISLSCLTQSGKISVLPDCVCVGFPSTHYKNQ